MECPHGDIYNVQTVTENLTRLWNKPVEYGHAATEWLCRFQKSNIAWSVSFDLLRSNDESFRMFGSQTLAWKLKNDSGSIMQRSDLQDTISLVFEIVNNSAIRLEHPSTFNCNFGYFKFQLSNGTLEKLGDCIAVCILLASDMKGSAWVTCLPELLDMVTLQSKSSLQYIVSCALASLPQVVLNASNPCDGYSGTEERVLFYAKFAEPKECVHEFLFFLLKNIMTNDNVMLSSQHKDDCVIYKDKLLEKTMLIIINWSRHLCVCFAKDIENARLLANIIDLLPNSFLAAEAWCATLENSSFFCQFWNPLHDEDKSSISPGGRPASFGIASRYSSIVGTGGIVSQLKRQHRSIERRSVQCLEGEKCFVSCVLERLKKLNDELKHNLQVVDKRQISTELSDNIVLTTCPAYHLLFKNELPVPTVGSAYILPFYGDINVCSSQTSMLTPLIHWVDVFLTLTQLWPEFLLGNTEETYFIPILYYRLIIFHPKISLMFLGIWDHIKEHRSNKYISDKSLLAILAMLSLHFLTTCILQGREDNPYWALEEDSRSVFIEGASNAVCTIFLLFSQLGEIHKEFLTIPNIYLDLFIRQNDVTGIEVILVLVDGIVESLTCLPYSFFRFLTLISNSTITSIPLAEALSTIVKKISIYFDSTIDETEIKECCCDMSNVTVERYTEDKKVLWLMLFKRLSASLFCSPLIVANALYELAWWGGYSVGNDMKKVEFFIDSVLDKNQISNLNPRVDGILFSVPLLLFYNYNDLDLFHTSALSLLRHAIHDIHELRVSGGTIDWSDTNTNSSSCRSAALYRLIVRIQSCFGALLKAPQSDKMNEGGTVTFRCQTVIAKFALEKMPSSLSCFDEIAEVFQRDVFLPPSSGEYSYLTCQSNSLDITKLHNTINQFIWSRTGKEMKDPRYKEREYNVNSSVENVVCSNNVCNNAPFTNGNEMAIRRSTVSPLAERLVRTWLFILGAPTDREKICDLSTQMVDEYECFINDLHFELQKKSTNIVLNSLNSVIKENENNSTLTGLFQMTNVAWHTNVLVEVVKGYKKTVTENIPKYKKYIFQQLSLTEEYIYVCLPRTLTFWHTMIISRIDNLFAHDDETRIKCYSLCRPLTSLISEICKRVCTEEKFAIAHPDLINLSSGRPRLFDSDCKCMLLKYRQPTGTSEGANSVNVSDSDFENQNLLIHCLYTCLHLLESYDEEVARSCLIFLFYAFSHKRGGELLRNHVEFIVTRIFQFMPLWASHRVSELWRVVSKISDRFPTEYLNACKKAAGQNQTPAGVFAVLNPHERNVALEGLQKLKGPRIRGLLQDLCNIKNRFLDTDSLLAYELSLSTYPSSNRSADQEQTQTFVVLD